MEDLNTSGLLGFFNNLYQNDADEKGFILSDKEEFQSVYDTLTKYNMPTYLFLENLKTLAMKKVTFEDGVTKASYLPKYNKLKYEDPKYIKHELFHMASTSKGETSGISYIAQNGVVVGEGLKEGITEMFSKLNDPDYQVQYPFEMMVAETLNFIYDGEDIFKFHFSNDSNGFLSALGDVRLGKELMVQLDKFRSSYIQTSETLNSGQVDSTDFYQTRFFFEQVLLKLTELYYKKGNANKQVFQLFMTNALNNPELEEVKMIVTGAGTKDLLDTKIKGKLF